MPMGAADVFPPRSASRPRKTLPPLSTPPRELSMAALDPAADTVVASETKLEIEQLLRNHLHFARAFKLNDAAMLMPFLDRDVQLTTYDGVVYEGVSAVLGFLVGSRMSKLSAALHVKGTPTRSGVWQSAFVYEHGLVFKEPLYSEVVDWSPQSSVILSLTHTRLSNPHDVGPPKSVSDMVKVVASLPHRLSLSDEDDAPLMSRRRSSVSRSSRTASSSTTDSVNMNGGAVITRIAVLTKLSPIRKRKLVNAFITVESESGELLWKSNVAKKQTLPVWSNVEVEIPPSEEDDFVEHRLLKLPDPHTPVVLTLWDYGFFRSLRVATTQVTAAELLRNERTGQSVIELKPMGLSSAHLQLCLSLERLGGSDDGWRPSLTTQESSGLDQSESHTAIVRKSRRGATTGWLDLDPFASASTSTLALVLLLAVTVSAVIWQHARRQTSAE